MRKPMMAGNWKMNKTVAEATALVSQIVELTSGYTNVDRVICPTFVCLSAVKAAVGDASIQVGAQNCYWEENGAFTGEVSAALLSGLVEYVIIGHSERRQFFGETDETVNKKVKAALAAGLTPIACIGESLAQNEAGETQSFVSGQVRGALTGLSGAQVASLVLAYEPIWAIGTGLAATSQQAGDICGSVVRATVRDIYGDGVAEAVRILYGGSTKPGPLTAEQRTLFDQVRCGPAKSRLAIAVPRQLARFLLVGVA